jgi:hypothetical protein
MFTPRSHSRSVASRPALGGRVTGTVPRSRTAAVLRLGLLSPLLAASVPDGVSAQALGTMQVTARVLPGQPGWTAVSEAGALVRYVVSTGAGAQSRHADLVQARSEVASVRGRRRLLITIHYPHN